MAKDQILRDRECLQCGKSPISGYKFCSNGCFQKALYARRALAPGYAEWNREQVHQCLERKFGPKPDGRQRRIRAAPHPCLSCMEPTTRPKYCSHECTNKGDAVARSRRIGSQTRRARKRGGTVEKFDPLEVLRRDKWKCHICGNNTPMKLRGTGDPRAPELDHIIPLSKGGEHSRLNTACSCRSCNIRKSSKPLGQLRLFA